jgi:hypothetical protein
MNGADDDNWSVTAKLAPILKPDGLNFVRGVTDWWLLPPL